MTSSRDWGNSAKCWRLWLTASLAQGRELFQDQQGASKNILEKLTEKLVALDKLVDVISQSIQKVSNETHAGFARAEQKADKNQATWWSEHGSLKSLLSSVVPMTRKIRPIACEGLPKGLPSFFTRPTVSEAG